MPFRSFHLLWKKKVFREIIDKEGRVFEPLECGHEWVVWGTLPPLNNQVEERFEPPSRGPLRGAALKLLQLAPLYLSLLGKDVFIIARPGWVPEEASSAQPFRGLLDKFQGDTGVSRSRGVNLIALNVGLMKSRKEFTTVMGKEKTGRATA